MKPDYYISPKKAVDLYKKTMEEKVDKFVLERKDIFDQIKKASENGERYYQEPSLNAEEISILRYIGYSVKEYTLRHICW